MSRGTFLLGLHSPLDGSSWLQASPVHRHFPPPF